MVNVLFFSPYFHTELNIYNTYYWTFTKRTLRWPMFKYTRRIYCKYKVARSLLLKFVWVTYTCILLFHVPTALLVFNSPVAKTLPATKGQPVGFSLSSTTGIIFIFFFSYNLIIRTNLHTKSWESISVSVVWSTRELQIIYYNNIINDRLYEFRSTYTFFRKTKNIQNKYM